MAGFTDTQREVLRLLYEAGGHRRLSGPGMAPYLSSAKSLWRRGFLKKRRQKSHYQLTEKGEAIAESIATPKHRFGYWPTAKDVLLTDASVSVIGVPELEPEPEPDEGDDFE